MIELGLELFSNLGLLAFIAVAYSILPRDRSQRPRPVPLGLLFGIGAILTMLDPVRIGPDLHIDSRTTIIVLAGYFGGPVAGLLAAVIAAIFRAGIGGIGAQPGILAIGIAAGIGLFGYFFMRRPGQPPTYRALILFSLLSPIPTVAVLLLPWELAMSTLAVTLLPTAILRALGVVLLGTIMIHEERRIAAEARVRQLASTDELSGLANRRCFYSELGHELERREISGGSVSVLLVDIDRFKSINDSYGHPRGDDVIRRLADALRRTCRASDLSARIGGEEFAVLLPETGAKPAQELAERIRSTVEQETVATPQGNIHFTVSIGVGTSTPVAPTIETLMNAADSALYAAKQGGRNQIAFGF
ncbi:GGDEF domain-containing protein [Amorphus orientalis]|uniref:diguanylate cyclase n=1 Tax=Amorphus orientalis TaxID=649198 RepID=A0AAE3VSC2_9HYPH|nr:diguanylate cyclase [Amorphus orientalis]MDQ0317058.1 diguanylate cyclase [Amorphus orientalis]